MYCKTYETIVGVRRAIVASRIRLWEGHARRARSVTSRIATTVIVVPGAHIRGFFLDRRVIIVIAGRIATMIVLKVAGIILGWRSDVVFGLLLHRKRLVRRAGFHYLRGWCLASKRLATGGVALVFSALIAFEDV